MSELIIKISAESKEFSDAVDDIKSKTEGLETQLASIAKISGVAFAGLIAAAGVTVKAFSESEKASNELELSLQNQGIASATLIDRYKKLATELQNKTGVDDDAIIKGQAVLQNFIGQNEISAELATSMVNLAEKTGSLESAAEVLGRAVGGNVRGLKQYGITIDEGLTTQERLAQITEKVGQKFDGQAEAANKGLGSFRGLQTAIGNFLEEIGKRLAPAISGAVTALTQFFQTLSANGPLIDFIVEAGKIGLIITGVITGLATAAITIIKLQQAFAIAQAAVTAFGLASKIAVGATGVGLLLVVAAEIYANWNKIFPVMQAVYTTFVSNISNLTSALGTILKGAFSLDPARIQQGLAEVRQVIAEGYDEINSLGEESVQKTVEQNAQKAENAAETAAAINAIDQQKAEQNNILQAQILADDANFQALSLEQQKLFLDQKGNQLRESIATAQGVQFAGIEAQAKSQIESNKRYLLEQQKFGTAYAEINKVLYSEQVQGASQSFGELAKLQQSSNSTLKTIGKAAAVGQITISTAESAMKAYAGFQSLPFGLGIPLGIAAAGAVVAFGGEQIAKVVSAQDGGIVPGINKGFDSVPAILQPGELVIPRQSAGETIDAVANQREGGVGVATIVLELKDSLMDFIETKLVERDRLNISIQGA